MKAIGMMIWFGMTCIGAHAVDEEMPGGFQIDTGLNRSRIHLSGKPRDSKPALDQPKTVDIDQAIQEHGADAIVYVVSTKKDSKAYPLSLLRWHPIVNDSIGGMGMVATYCTHSMTFIAFLKFGAKSPLSFAYSGLLFENNLLFYDRQTESLWSQLTMKSVSGKNRGTSLESLPSARLSLAQVKSKFPKIQVVSSKTGFEIDYRVNPDAEYETSDTFYFPIPTSLRNQPHLKSQALLLLPSQPSESQWIVPTPLEVLSKAEIKSLLKVNRLERFENGLDCPLQGMPQGTRCVRGARFALLTHYPDAKIIPLPTP